MSLSDEQIGAELVALRPAPHGDFVAQLDDRVATGFRGVASERGDTLALRGLARLKRPRWRPLMPALGAIALAAVVAAAVIANSDHTAEHGQLLSKPEDQSAKLATPQQGPTAVAPSAGAGSAGSAGEAVPPFEPLPPNGTPPRNGRPQIQKLSGALGLTTASDKIGEAADGVVDVTNRYDGFVDSSDVHVGGSRAHAFFTLRIPANQLREALDDLSDLGKVVSRDEGSTNVTGAYVDAGKSYRDARARVDSLLEDLRSGSSTSEAAAIRAQLVTARQQLAASRDVLRGVKQRVTYAPVSVQIRAADDGSWSIGDAADDAVGVLQAIGGGALITLAVLVPLALLVGLGWLGARELRRRNRESALDS